MTISTPRSCQNQRWQKSKQEQVKLWTKEHSLYQEKSALPKSTAEPQFLTEFLVVATLLLDLICISICSAMLKKRLRAEGGGGEEQKG